MDPVTDAAASPTKRSSDRVPDPVASESSLRAEIYKRHPFDTPAQEAFLNLLRTTSVLDAPFERLLRDHGLSTATYNVLRILRGSGSTGRVCHEIGRHLVARVPDVTRLIDRLEKQGLAKRTRGDSDRRLVRVVITQEGLDVLAKLDAPIMEAHLRQMSHMSDEELNTLSRLLAKARAPHMGDQLD
jgi:DNA-binding MarR family transcriptional regulator